jgi:hypothetical protein
MAQPLTTTQVAAIVTDAIGFTWSSCEELVKEVYPRFLREYKTPHARLISEPVAGFGEVPKLAEGASIEYDELGFGTPLEIGPEQFALGFRATRASLLDMGKNPFGEFSSAKLVAAAKIGEYFRNSSSQTRDIYAAQVLLSGDSATASAKWIGSGNNSEALYANTHTIIKNTALLGSTTYDNLLGGTALSQSAVNTAIETLETMPSQEGLIRPYRKSYKLVCGPNNRSNAFEAIETAKMNKVADSFDHTKPAVSDYDITLIVNPFMGASSTRWAIFSEDAKVGYWISQKDELDDEKDFETKGHKWSTYSRWRFFHLDSFGTVLDPGA